MKIYQGYFEYFFGAGSGYGTVKTKYTNVFSTQDLCLENLQDLIKSYEVKEWLILEYDLDSDCTPNIIKKINCNVTFQL
jgi:hypothetical protein